VAHGRQSRFPQRSNASRRAVSWSNGPGGVLSGIVNSSSNLFPIAVQALLDDLTLVRTRGDLLVYLTVAGGAANEGFEWAFGICNVTENAAGIGVTAVPDPIADVSWDGWFVYEKGRIVSRATTLVESDNVVNCQRVRIDSKAMRKIHDTDVLVAVIATTEAGEGAAMSAGLTTRVLDKLH